MLPSISTTKPVLLYYCSASTVLSYGDTALEKISRVLKIFSENPERLTILWYRDPLLSDILEKTAPDFYSRFLTLLDEAAALGFTVIDTPLSAQEEQQLAELCSAYYGDGGFPATCFISAGKPVMIQNIEI